MSTTSVRSKARGKPPAPELPLSRPGVIPIRYAGGPVHQELHDAIDTLPELLARRVAPIVRDVVREVRYSACATTYEDALLAIAWADRPTLVRMQERIRARYGINAKAVQVARRKSKLRDVGLTAEVGR